MKAAALFVVLAASSVAAAQQPSSQPVGPPRGGAFGRVTEIASGETCPPGQTEVRPHRCLAPEFAPPSIVDYRPRSTLVVTAHAVPRAKFPAIDYHGHPNQLVA